MNNAVLEVVHFKLNPADREANKLASICPACKEGSLGMVRRVTDFVLEPFDVCLLCGQQVVYTDIEDVRAQDWAGGAGS